MQAQFIDVNIDAVKDQNPLQLVQTLPFIHFVPIEEIQTLGQTIKTSTPTFIHVSEVEAPAFGGALQISSIRDVETSVVMKKRSRAQFETFELEPCDDQLKRRRLAAQQATTIADKAMKEAKKKEKEQAFDPKVIDNAVSELKLKKTEEGVKRGRGRKTTRSDIYIKDSLDTIKEIQKQLTEGDKTLSKEAKRLLRNKKSALQNRVNQKLHTEQLKGEMKDFGNKFQAIAEECLKEIPQESLQRLLNRIIDIQQKSEPADLKQRQNASLSNKRSCKASKADLMNAMKQYLGI